jgi:hypothetical protein
MWEDARRTGRCKDGEGWLEWMDEVNRRRVSKTHERGKTKIRGLDGGKIEAVDVWLTMVLKEGWIEKIRKGWLEKMLG